MKISLSFWIFNKLMKHNQIFSNTTLIKYEYIAYSFKSNKLTRRWIRG